MSSSFWNAGADRVRKALRAKRKEIDRLTRELEQAGTEAERRALEERLRTLIENGDPSERDVDHSLFLHKRS